ncbi:hypothetical protein NKG94_46585 [Micromonospora sp. M12]
MRWLVRRPGGRVTCGRSPCGPEPWPRRSSSPGSSPPPCARWSTRCRSPSRPAPSGRSLPAPPLGRVDAVFFAVVFFAAVFFAVAFVAAVLLAAVFLTADALVAAFRAGAFVAAVVFRAGAFVAAVVFFAAEVVVFLAALTVFLAVPVVFARRTPGALGGGCRLPRRAFVAAVVFFAAEVVALVVAFFAGAFLAAVVVFLAGRARAAGGLPSRCLRGTRGGLANGVVRLAAVFRSAAAVFFAVVRRAAGGWWPAVLRPSWFPPWGRARVRPRGARNASARAVPRRLFVLPDPTSVLGIPRLVALLHSLQGVLRVGRRVVRAENVLRRTHVGVRLDPVMPGAPVELPTTFAVAHGNHCAPRTGRPPPDRTSRRRSPQ